MGDLFGLGSKAIDNVRSVLRDEGSAFFETASIDDYFLTDGLKNPASLQEIAPKVNKEPIMQIYPRGELGGDFTNVFAPNLSGLVALLEMCEFEIVKAENVNSYARGRAMAHAKAINDHNVSFYRNRELVLLPKGVANI